MNPQRVIAEANLIYKVKSGSHAYGTNLATSDDDFSGIFIPPVEYYFGLQSFDMLSDQSEDDHNYYSLRKYATLAVANNPNVLEVLFTDPSDVLLATVAGQALHQSRHLFLSQKCKQTFIGYAKAQLFRIKRHTTWIAQELQDMGKLWVLVKGCQVTRQWVAWRFGENMVTRVENQFKSDEKFNEEYIGQASHLLSVAKNFWVYGTMGKTQDDNAVEHFKDSALACPAQNDPKFFRETPNGKVYMKHLYDEAKKKRDQYVTWMAERNPDRHKNELEFGYDTKHAMHLVRLLRAGYEVLTTGDLHVRRSDAAELLDIRAGRWSYDQVIEHADEMVEQINLLPSSACKVPEVPPVREIDNLIVRITRAHLAGHGEHT